VKHQMFALAKLGGREKDARIVLLCQVISLILEMFKNNKVFKFEVASMGVALKSLLNVIVTTQVNGQEDTVIDVG